ncbi:MAG: DUF4097 domain-containing protein [Oscillospiraceae bacterium]|nr:DUF4097 domain-containing protein [Oscillospiraceae bacterium]
MFKQIIKKSIINPNRVIAVLLVIAVLSGAGAYFVQYRFGGSSVYRVELSYEVKPFLSIITAGMPVEVASWDGSEIKLVCVSELPLIIEETEDEIKINQDDGFAVSFLTVDIFNYNLKVLLPRDYEYKEIHIISAGGDVSIKGQELHTSRVTVSAKNGNIGIDNVNSLVNIKTITGDINLDFISFLSSAYVESVSGDIDISVPDYSSLSLDYFTYSGRLYTGSFFPREFDGYMGTAFARKGVMPHKLHVVTHSGNLHIKEKNTDAIGNYPVI